MERTKSIKHGYFFKKIITINMHRDEACAAYNCTIEMYLSTLVCRKHLDADLLKILNSTLVDLDIFVPLLF